MILLKVRLNNFRQYYDEVEVCFSTCKEKNITLVHGENGVGKTALLNAIKWCLYGEFTNNFRNPSSLINNEAVKEGKASCYVEIEFKEGDEHFVARRLYSGKETFGTSKRALRGVLKLYKLEEGVYSAELHEPELIINRLLPSEMSDYFFFQGEGSNTVDTGNSKIDLQESIRNILGFRVAQNTRATLNSKLRAINKEIAEKDKTNEASEVNTKVEQLKDTIEEDERYLEELNKKNIILEERIDDIDKKLAQIDNADLYRLRTEEGSLLKKKTELESKINKLFDEKRQLISQYGWAVYGKNFADDSLDFIDTSILQGRLPEPYNESFINSLLKEAECICGSSLQAGSQSYFNVKKLLEKAANPMLLSRVNQVHSHINAISTHYNSAKKNIPFILSQYNEAVDQKDNIVLSLQAISEEILRIPENTINKLHSEKKKIFNELKSKLSIVGRMEMKIAANKQQYEYENSRLRSLLLSKTVVDDKEIERDFIVELIKELDSHLEKTQQRVQMHIVSKVNDILKRFSRHNYEIRFRDDKKFEIFLVNSDGEQIGQGDGLNLLLNLSITAALIGYVRENKNVKDPLLSSATIAPLVIDAPFGVLDEAYRRVVIKELPNYADQVVFFVSSSQWTSDMADVVRDKIGEQYYLLLEERAEQGETPIDIIKIGQKSFVASKYGCDKDRVKAVRVR